MFEVAGGGAEEDMVLTSGIQMAREIEKQQGSSMVPKAWRIDSLKDLSREIEIDYQ
jgi:hypothetical protein